MTPRERREWNYTLQFCAWVVTGIVLMTLITGVNVLLPKRYRIKGAPFMVRWIERIEKGLWINRKQ